MGLVGFGRIRLLLGFALCLAVVPAQAQEKTLDARIRFCEEAWVVIREQAKLKHTIIGSADVQPTEMPDPTLYLKALLEGYLRECPEPEGLHRKEAQRTLNLLADGAQAGDARLKKLSAAMDFDVLPTQTEWFSLRAMGGTYGEGVEASLFTIRWRVFVWEIMRGGGARGGRGFRNKPNSVFFYGGTAFGPQIQVGPTPLNELRFMTGIFGGVMSQDVKSSGTMNHQRIWAVLRKGPTFSSKSPGCVIFDAISRCKWVSKPLCRSIRD